MKLWLSMELENLTTKYDPVERIIQFQINENRIVFTEEPPYIFHYCKILAEIGKL